jgi:hypothetical protein
MSTVSPLTQYSNNDLSSSRAHATVSALSPSGVTGCGELEPPHLPSSCDYCSESSQITKKRRLFRSDGRLARCRSGRGDAVRALFLHLGLHCAVESVEYSYM